MKRVGFLKITVLKLLILSAVFLLISNIVPSIVEISNIPAGIRLSSAELENLNIRHIGVQIDGVAETASFNSGINQCKLKFKLFNILPIKSVSAEIEPERKVYLGGFPVGISLKVNGVLVVQKVEIDTYAGKVKPNSGIVDGDIIIEMNGKRVLYASDITENMQNFGENDRIVEMVVLRHGEEVKITAYPVIENLTGYYRLGLAVKDIVDGIGTVSYIRTDGRFACLGHPISGNENNRVLPCYSGNIYDCKILGYCKGSKGVPGELKGAFTNTSSPIGRIEKNNEFGVYGTANKSLSAELIDVGSRHLVKMGKAQIVTTVNDKLTYYDIEIVKANVQNSPNEKGMIIRVTDKNLLSTTGGILQGMSGSPIIQDNKIIGAVTHVFLNDPTKGFGVYADWMYEN